MNDGGNLFMALFGFLGCRPVAWLDGANVNRFANESTRDRNITSCVMGSLALRLQFVDMVTYPQAVFRAFSYASVNAILVWSHILCDLAISSAMRISDKALPCLLRFWALGVAHPDVQNQYDEPYCQHRRSCLQVLFHRSPRGSVR